jgi:DNA helicase-2/ATP-dependent DNA helicase PcrA
MQKYRLGKSYRSSGPISALAFQLMRRIDPCFEEKYSYFNRDGKKPQLIITDNIAESIAGHIPGLSCYNTIGIITPSGDDASDIYKALQAHVDLQLVTDPLDGISKRIAVLPLILAKGLEFDEVIIPEANNQTYSSEYDRSLLYIACTRAMHRLTLIYTGELTQLISS